MMMSKRMARTSVLVAVLALGVWGCGGSEDGPGGVDADTSGSDGSTGNIDAASGQPDAASGQPDATGSNPGHTVDLGGEMHEPGYDDPLANCVSCHGSNLNGGTGPSCYDCHNNDDHTINHNGHMHMSGTYNSCATCHGPSNTGGLGPACSECH